SKAQRDQLVTTTHATAAGVGAAENFTMAHNLAEANARVDAAIKADPINYAISSKINGEAPLAYDPSNVQAFSTGLQRRQQTNTVMTQEQGAAPAIFSKSEAQQFSDYLSHATPDKQLSFITDMRRGLSDPRAYQLALNQLGASNPNVSYAGNAAFHFGQVSVGAEKITGHQVGQYILEGTAILNGGGYTGNKQDGKPGSDDPNLPK